jgi:hypothetical protein
MARNVDKGSSKKVHPTGIVEHANGPTSTINDPAKFPNKGKTTGKTPSNGVEDAKTGPTFTCNSTHIPTMNADKAPKESKTIASKQGGAINIKTHETAGDLTASQTGDGMPTNKPYPLKDRYDKSGSKDSGRLPKAE